MISSISSLPPTHLATSKIPHTVVIPRESWLVHLHFYYLHLFAGFLLYDCLHKAQTGSLCNWILLWNGEIGLWAPFTKCCSTAPSEVLLDTVYCNLGKISMTDSGEKKGNYSF